MPILYKNKHRYPSDWKEISKRIRFDRAGGRCECDGRCRTGRHGERCDERHGEKAQTFRGNVVLTTAHLDHTPENNDDGNLLAMCQLCHLMYDRPHHMAKRVRPSQRTANG